MTSPSILYRLEFLCEVPKERMAALPIRARAHIDHYNRQDWEVHMPTVPCGSLAVDIAEVGRRRYGVAHADVGKPPDVHISSTFDNPKEINTPLDCTL